MLAEFHAADLINPPASTAVTVDNTTSSKVKVHEDTIIQCAIAGDTTKLRRWARQGVRVFTAQPLCQAALAGNLDVVKCLIKELGADVSQGAQKGFTALHAAAQGGHTAILLYLVKKLGANVNQANDDGASPLVQAVLLGSLSTVQCLAKDLKADVNQATQEGATPLSIAAQEGHVDIARFLIKECGVDVNQTMMDGTTPLSMAAQQGRVDMIRCLGVEFGADANKCRLDGNSPLYVAASNGRHLDLISCLVKELGADINHAASDGTTPLMMASKNKHAEVVRWLLKYGANAQAQMQYNGKTYNAAIVSKEVRAPAEQTTYLVAKTFCANQVESFSCGDAGRKRCASCEVVFYCGLACQAAHWPVHKTACKQSAGLKASKAK
jgi:ankyrin repeat protein